MADDLAQAAREAPHLKPGQRLQVEVTADGGLLLRPIRLDPLSVATVLGRPPRHKASLKDARAIDEAAFGRFGGRVAPIRRNSPVSG